MNILHITAHLGGGVGRAISSLVMEEKINRHRIICLQQPEKMQFVKLCKAAGAGVLMVPPTERICQEMSRCDVLIVHWWDHPVMVKFLAEFPSIPVRLVLWVHISGCSYPFLPYSFLNKAQAIFFTTPYSYENPEWSEKELTLIRKKSCVMYGSGVLHPSQHMRDEAAHQKNYCIGYAGTFARSKIHPSFVQACYLILHSIPETRFLLAGDLDKNSWVLKEAEALGIRDHFICLGYLENMEPFWDQIDVFGYPLNPQHFGTTENVILEAMCAGVPVVLLNQAAEKYIITHKISGILAENIEDYADWIIRLYYDPSLRVSLGKQAIKRTKDKFDHALVVRKFQSKLVQSEKKEKQIVSFVDVLGREPIDWFMSALPHPLRCNFLQLRNGKMSEKEEKLCIDHLPFILKEMSKSSITHFARIFPEDTALKKLELKILRHE